MVKDAKEAFSFEKLRVYQDSLEFSKKIYELTKIFPKDEIFGITSQLRRASYSVPLNIAEGSGLTKSEFKNFLRKSRGSLYECVPILSIALENKYITDEHFKMFYRECLRLSKSVSALINSIK
jgi:four helix bundle protein